MSITRDAVNGRKKGIRSNNILIARDESLGQRGHAVARILYDEILRAVEMAVRAFVVLAV